MRPIGLLTRLTWVMALTGLVCSPGQALSQDAVGTASRQTKITDAAGRVHYRMKRITQAEREAAAARLKAIRAAKPKLQAGATSAAAAGLLAAAPAPLPITSLVTGPNGQLIPDYSGVTPNYANSPILRKFVDGLPGLCGPGGAGKNNLGQCIPVAVADTLTYAGSDYYEIELGEYSEQLHSDLPVAGTRLRGYRQTNTADPEASRFHYLGPLIIAQKGRPVRIKFTNNLPTGAGGNLFIPVDTTIMGAGPGPNVSDATRTGTPADVLCQTAPGAAVPAGCYTQNRATLHLHGGVTPWISDGTTHQWITPAGETEYPKGVSVYNVPDMPNPGRPTTPDPGAGVQTFYYTNDQSARLMFYHDHASGITRLNVYAGEAAGYLLQDPTETDLVARGIIPADQIPLILQDKTFVNAATIGVQDPTWNWGTGAIDPATGRRLPNTGDLWWPHVYMAAQNPYEPGGMNAMGRWHYGPWFWPPTTNIPYGPVANPYYDPINAPWQPPMIPGAPNPSWGAEAFLDTPVINGTAYPTLTVQPKAYRFRILDASHDRFFNLSMFVAADKNTQTTAVPDPLLPPTALCNAGVPAADCTEVKMVPAVPNTPGFPATWPTDGREGGAPDPATKGPDWIQIGTEGGFLPMPVVIPAQPVTWNLDPTTFNMGNVQDHSLLLGPAERADVIVDFSAYAGKTLILYNDAPTAFPALDPRTDYYTGAPDLTDTGGVPGALPGFGPNTRTVMQIVVASGTGTPFDQVALQTEFLSTPTHPGVFERSQDPIIVGQAAYDDAYSRTTTPETFPTAFPYWGFAGIGDNSMSLETVAGPRVTLPLEPKAIQDEMGEVFDDYGRMSAKLGLELPKTVAGIQTFILQGYADPPTELIKLSDSAVPIGTPAADGTQLWKITHNGVDTHPIHFHLFHVQLVNRVGWDGAIRPPDANELGWKDTVRISPLEDTIVALRPIAPVPASLPFKVPNSFRPHEPALSIGSTLAFTNIDPNGNPVTVTNEVSNYGWEYVWHCHILSHEENDMMRAVVFAATPESPTALSATNSLPADPPAITLTWLDNSLTASGFRVERATDAAFTANLTQVNLGVVATYTDADPALIPGQVYYYRVVALNTVGSSVPGYPTITAESAPAVYPVITFVPGSLMAQLSPVTLAFGPQALGTTSAAQTVTLTNVGGTALTINSITLTGANMADFALSANTCGATLDPALSCTLDVAFAPSAVGARSAGLVFNTSDPGYPLQTVSLSGTGSGPIAGIAPTALVFAAQLLNTTSAAQTLTLSNTGATSLTINSIGLTGVNAADFAQSGTCTATLAAGTSCAINVTFAPAGTGARAAGLVVSSSDTLNPVLTVALSGTGTGSMAAVTPTTLTFATQVVGTTSGGQLVTLSNNGNAALTINGIALTGLNAADFAQVNVCGTSLAAGSSCFVIVTFTPTLGGARTANLAITTNDPVNPGLLVLLGGSGAAPVAGVTPASLPFGNQQVGTTSAAQSATLSNTGNAPLTINSIGVTGANAADFTQTNACGATLAPAASCIIMVTFTPAAVGARSASVSISTNDPATPTLALPLTGSGTTPVAGVAPTSLTFSASVGTTSAAQTATLSNTGSAPLTINSISITGTNAAEFGLTNPCGASVAAGASCILSVTFTPAAAGARTAAVSISSNDPVNPSLTVALSGTGGQPVAAVAPTSLTFAAQAIGTTSPAQTATLSNTGNAPLTINSISVTGTNAAEFGLTNPCGASVAAGASCILSVTFAPAAAGARTAAVSISSNDPVNPSLTVTLSGSGGQPAAAVTPTSLAFAPQTVGFASAAQTATLSNSGTGPLAINSITLTGANSTDFGLTNPCGPIVTAGGSCILSVTFTPTAVGARSASISIGSNDPVNPSLTVGLSGTGILTEQVVWTSAVGVSVSGNNLTDTGGTGWGNSGAVSTRAIASGDGFVEITASELTSYRMFGLSNGNSNANYTDIDFALYLDTNRLRIFERGTERGTGYGTYATGDVLRVSVEGGVVTYRKNGTLLYTSTVAPTYPLLLDTALQSQGSTIQNAVISGDLIGSPAGTPTTPTPAPTPAPVTTEQVVWTSAVGVSVSGNNLTDTGGTGWGNSGAVSTRAIASGDGFVEITASELTSYRMFGLSNGNSNANYTDIDFALYLDTNRLRIFERGTERGTGYGTYATGDVLRVSVEGGVVTYRKNGTLLYTSTVAPTYPLLLDTALQSEGSTIQNAAISGSLSGSPVGAPATPALPLTPAPVTTEQAAWTSAVGVSVSGNNLTDTGGTGWGNSGAVSTRAIASGDGFVEITASELTSYRMFGLSNGNSNANYTDIDFALYLDTNRLRIFERGTERGTGYGTYATGDVLRVSVEGGVVTYRKNGALLYTSTVAPAHPLLLDTALQSQGSTIQNAMISGVLQ